jgi:hypothetical protein
VKFVSLLRRLAFYAEAAKKASVAKKDFSDADTGTHDTNLP